MIAPGQLYFPRKTMNTITPYQPQATRPTPVRLSSADAVGEVSAEKPRFRRLWNSRAVDQHAVVTYNATAGTSQHSLPRHIDTYA